MAQIYDKDDITGEYREFNIEVIEDINYEKLAKRLFNIKTSFTYCFFNFFYMFMIEGFHCHLGT